MTAPRLEAAALDGFGAFFAVSAHDTPPDAPWLPLGELVRDRTALRRRVDAVRDALARGAGRRVEDVEMRVAASTAHFGLVARLLSPAVAVAAVGPFRLDLALDGVWWQDRLGEPFPLSVPAELIETPTLVGGTAIEAVTEAVEREFAVSTVVLWGNVGSATNTAARLVSGARPDLAARAGAAADALLVDHQVEGGVLRTGPDFRRRSCCLIYRVSNDTSAVCSDCVLTGAR